MIVAFEKLLRSNFRFGRMSPFPDTTAVRVLSLCPSSPGIRVT